MSWAQVRRQLLLQDPRNFDLLVESISGSHVLAAVGYPGWVSHANVALTIAAAHGHGEIGLDAFR